jgi:hypothetical protein
VWRAACSGLEKIAASGAWDYVPAGDDEVNHIESIARHFEMSEALPQFRLAGF